MTTTAHWLAANLNRAIWTILLLAAAAPHMRAVPLIGTVTDPASAPIASAAVTVTNNSTSAVFMTSTLSDGTFSIPNLPPGTYTVNVAAVGFRQTRVVNLVIGSLPLGLNIGLVIGEPFEIIIVQANPFTVPPIPTLSQWGMAVFTVLLMATAALYLLRKQTGLCTTSGVTQNRP